MIKRRKFLKTSALSSVGVLVMNRGIFGAGKSPGEKLNIALVGVAGRGAANTAGVKSENIVALCDVNGKNMARAVKQFPKAKTYVDWRKCLEQKDIDAVVCSTTDHTHAFVTNWALNRDKHVYCEKPLANSVHEARTVRENYLKRKDKVATQMGTQIHASENFRRVVELVRGGAIGSLKSIHAWCSRLPQGGSYLPEQKPIPDNVNWDLWIGPSPVHPYNSGYLKSCLTWNRFWDFGSGQIGDMGSHIMDLAFWGADLRFPTSCQAGGNPKKKEKPNPDTCPTQLMATWEHPKNDWRPAVTVSWYDGGLKPGMPLKAVNRDGLFKGVLFKGDKGSILGDYHYRIMFPNGDMTHYKAPKAEELIPKSPGHHREWINGCKTGSPTLCNFDYSGAMIENNLLGLVAYRVGKKLEWDAKNLKATNCPEADQYIKKTYREGWVLDG